MTHRLDVVALGALLALSLLVGGAGVTYPSLQLILQVSALALICYLLATPRSWHFSRLTWLVLGLLGAILLYPLLQLLPLPPSVWTVFPGRNLPAAADAALGLRLWRPLSLDVEGTLRSFLSLIPAAAVFFGCVFLKQSQLLKLLWVVVVAGLLGAILGTVQFAADGWLTPYKSAHVGHSLGFFVNRNHHAAMMLVTMPAVAILFRTTDVQRGAHASVPLVGLSALVVLAVGVLGTTSRIGLILLPLTMAVSLGLLFYRQARAAPLWPISVLIIALVTTALLLSGRLSRTLSRFTGLDDARFEYWTDSGWALGHYGLAGTGFGTFIPVHQSAESLDSVTPRLINHAHNDFIELFLEGGAIAALLAFLAFVTLAVASYRSIRLSPSKMQTTIAALTGTTILLAISAVDYPLRMPALSSVFALYCSILLSAGESEERDFRAVLRAGGLFSAARAAVVSIVLIAAMVLSVQAGLSASALANGQNEAAAKWAGWSTKAHERLSTQALIRQDFQAAHDHGIQALRLSPISAPGLRSVGLASIARGDTVRGNRLMQLAVALGWRDPFSQLWAIEAAKLSGEPEKAVQRAEALFRQGMLVVPATALLLDPKSEGEILPVLAHRLSEKPGWRQEFFESGRETATSAFSQWLSLIVSLQRTVAPVSADEGAPSVSGLLDKGRIADARRIWSLFLDKDSFVINGDFHQVRGSGSDIPLGWSIPRPNRSFLSVKALGPTQANRALFILSAKSLIVLRQRMLLEPGTYILSYRVRTENRSGASLRWELRCTESGHREKADRSVAAGRGWDDVTVEFTVPYRDCPVQELVLKPTSDKSIERVWLDEIRLRGELS